MHMNWKEVMSIITIVSILPGTFLFVMIVILICECFAYKNWDCGIRKENQKLLQVHCPFDSTKGVLYIPRRVIGFWMNEKQIHRLNNEIDNRKILEMLFRNYNLILYIPEHDNHNVYVSDLNQSIKFIIDNDFPVCYITQHLPIRSKTTPFSCNDDKLWFIMYKKGEPVDKWEGYS